jgi:small-conductance mechanosensitive channel
VSRIAAHRPNFNPASLYALNRLLHYTVLTLGFAIALASLGLDLDKFALFASALGVGVGFGLQNMVSNFVAGMMLLFEKTLKVGDFIELESGITGEVREINFRSTVVTTNDNVDIVVPNSVFVQGHVMNWTMREANRRIHVPFGVAYGSDKELVRKAVLEAAATVGHTLAGDERRTPQVWLVGFGDSSLDFELIVWLNQQAVKRPAAVKADYLWAIETALGKYHIEIPFPQRDLHIRSWSRTSRLPALADQAWRRTANQARRGASYQPLL